MRAVHGHGVIFWMARELPIGVVTGPFNVPPPLTNLSGEREVQVRTAVGTISPLPATGAVSETLHKSTSGIEIPGRTKTVPSAFRIAPCSDTPSIPSNHLQGTAPHVRKVVCLSWPTLCSIAVDLGMYQCCRRLRMRSLRSEAQSLTSRFSKLGDRHLAPGLPQSAEACDCRYVSKSGCEFSWDCTS